MALRAAVCIGSGTQRNASLLSSLPGRLRIGFHVPVAAAPPPRRISCARNQFQFAFEHPIRAIHGATTADPGASKTEDEQSRHNWKIKMLYDGDCPLCMREVNMLRERNKLYGTIKFVDISSDDYSPLENQGLDYKTVMGSIHAILSDGTVVTDVEAFRKLYEEVGLGWVYAITKYKPIATIANAVYGVWAKYRLQITGRPPLEVIMEARSKNKVEECKDNTCKM